jgi:hypothetical protein
VRIWTVEYHEYHGAAGSGILFDRDETGQDRPLVFADSAYAQAVQAFNTMRDDRLSFHTVSIVGEFGPDAHAHLIADDGSDQVELRPYDVIGG